MNSPTDHKPIQQRSSIRMDARLDQATRQKVDDLSQHFHRPRAAVLCHIMQWGLSRERAEPLDPGASHGPVHHLYCYVTSDLHQRVQQAVTAAGVKAAPWLRHMVRQIAVTDFPASWQEATPHKHSHDSRIYTERFMLRLDDLTREKLKDLSTHFDTSAAEIIRHLLAQAKPEDFPTSWHIRAAERRVPRVP